MAITLPDFTALPQVTPQATGNLAQYPSTDAGAQGMAVLGKGLEAAGGAATDIGAYQDIARTKMDRALADAYFTNQTIPITEQLKVETDPEKITALRGQFRTALQDASTSIGNPDARAMWMAHRAEVVGRGEAEADLRNVAVVRDRHKAGIYDQANESVRTSVPASDPQAFDLALHHIDTLAQSAVDYGSMSSVEAQNFRTKMRADLVAGRIDTLIARGQLPDAKTLLDGNRGYVGGVAGAELDARIEKAGTAARTYGSATRALGLSPPLPTGGSPGQTSAAEHYTYLTSIGASPNEAALLTSAAGAESGFDPTKTHDGGIGYGLYGHNQDRLTAMRGAAGTQTPSWQQQAQFALGELRTRPEGAQVNAAKTPEQLTDLQFQFEQPKRGPGDQADARLASTREYMLNPPKGPAAAGAGGAMPGVIDKTSDAGVGQRFGPLQSPQGMVIHHTAGGESVNDVIATFKKTNFPAQFIIDRQGKIYQTIPDGYQGQHVRDSYGPLGAGKGNANMEGVEIIANNDGDVLPVQQAAAARLVAMRAQKYGYDPKTSVFGHGELNPGHKQADEGMSTLTRIRNGSLPTQVSAAPGATGAPAGGAPAATGAAPSGVIEVRGDSLGVGLKGRLNAGGTAVGGARPTAILADIKKEPDSYWQGKTVVLPSGSNGNEMGVVEDTIKYLQDDKRGAKVIAVGYGPKFPEKNAQLREIAGRLKVPVIDAEDVDPKDGVHPSPRGYQSMAEKIRTAAAVPSAPAAAPVKPPAGLVAAPTIDLSPTP